MNMFFDFIGDLMQDRMRSNTIPAELVKDAKSSKPSFENRLKVLIWPPKDSSVGHAALDLCIDDNKSRSSSNYISFWPNVGKPKYAVGQHRGKMSTYENDVTEEKSEPLVFYLYTLNKDEVIKKSQELKEKIENGDIMYIAAAPLTRDGECEQTVFSKENTHNCCTIIWNILVAGGIFLLVNGDDFNASTSTGGNGLSLIGPTVSMIRNIPGMVPGLRPRIYLPKISTTANPESMMSLLKIATERERKDPEVQKLAEGRE